MAEPSQLAEYGRALRTELVARGVPFTVSDGPEPTGPTKYSDRMVLEHRDGGDSFSRTGTRKGNPPVIFTRSVAARLKIYAQSTAAGATYAHHKGRAELALDHAIAALDNVIRSAKSQVRFTGGGFDVPADLADSQVRSGALYVLDFEFDRGVADKVSWTEDGLQVFTLGAGSITNVTQVYQTGNEDAAAETGCGG